MGYWKWPELDFSSAALQHGDKLPSGWACLRPHQQLRQLRRRANVSQKELARRCGWPPSAICRAERGVGLRWTTIERYLAGLGLRPILLPYRGYELLSIEEARGRAIVEDLKRHWDARLRSKLL